VVARLRRGGRRLRRAADPIRIPPAASPDDQWQRVVLNRTVGAYIDSLDPSSLSAAEISGDTHASRPWRKYTSLMYPEFDICAPVEQPERYDVVICEQVLEHVVDPSAAAANLRELCVPGGRVIVSTPFLIRLHELPDYGMGDYWRFTPRGIRTLLERGGLEVESVGTWGNRDCVIAELDRWSAYRWWHSLRNEEELPVQIWAFAKNPG